MKYLNVLASLLLVIGGLNWGLISVIDLDIVASLFGAGTMITNVIYGLVGLSAINHIIKGKVFEE